MRLFLRAVASCLREHSPGSGPAARLGAVAFIHRFGSTLNPHLHFHCVVSDGVFDAAATGGIIFTAATGVNATATSACWRPTRPCVLPSPPSRRRRPALRKLAQLEWSSVLDDLKAPPGLTKYRLAKDAPREVLAGIRPLATPPRPRRVAA